MNVLIMGINALIILKINLTSTVFSVFKNLIQTSKRSLQKYCVIKWVTLKYNEVDKQPHPTPSVPQQGMKQINDSEYKTVNGQTIYFKNLICIYFKVCFQIGVLLNITIVIITFAEDNIKYSYGFNFIFSEFTF